MVWKHWLLRFIFGREIPRCTMVSFWGLRLMPWSGTSLLRPRIWEIILNQTRPATYPRDQHLFRVYRDLPAPFSKSRKWRAPKEFLFDINIPNDVLRNKSQGEDDRRSFTWMWLVQSEECILRKVEMEMEGKSSLAPWECERQPTVADQIGAQFVVRRSIWYSIGPGCCNTRWNHQVRRRCIHYRRKLVIPKKARNHCGKLANVDLPHRPRHPNQVGLVESRLPPILSYAQSLPFECKPMME